jgi:thioredoxin-disulfide reductase
MVYDVIIMGGGVAGLGAAVYSARFELKTLVIAGELGGLLQKTHEVENYIGIKKIKAMDLTNNIIEHAKSYKQVTIKEELAKDVKKGKIFKVKTGKGTYEGKTLIFATGSFHRELNVPGEKELRGKGVSYCGTCDGPLFAGKTVSVVGGSDSAAKEALLLAQYAKKVYIIYRGEKIRAEPIITERVEAHKKIEIIYKANVKEVAGNPFLDHAILDREYKNSKEIKLDGLFVEIGYIPKTELAEKIGVKLNRKHEIIINKHSETNVPGVFGAGDCTNSDFKQAITGVAEGVRAAERAYTFINH